MREPAAMPVFSPECSRRMTNSNQNNGFFAVDVRSFAEACADVNMATAYLVMARGTGGDNVTTAWSVNAIEKHTNMSRNRRDRAAHREAPRSESGWRRSSAVQVGKLGANPGLGS